MLVLTFESGLNPNPYAIPVDEILIQMKANEQYFPVILFIMLCKVVLTFESVDEILNCDH